MNVYDFDKTICKKDCTIEFYKYCLKHDISLLRFFPEQLFFYILSIFGYDRTKAKSKFFSFLKGMKRPTETVSSFWSEKSDLIYPWYLIKKSRNDVIISASPIFLVKPIMESLGVRNIIASNIDIHSGTFIGINCKGEEKVKRFNEVFPNMVIDEFYSDSYSDLPLALMAQNAYIVKNGNISTWNYKKENTND